jgi:6,7-dimethyl-8-ribityllumazine synthase
MSLKIIEGGLQTADLKFAIVAARFNEFVVERLLNGALKALKVNGVDEANILVVRVPGAFEMPVVAKKLAASGGFNAIVALGAVIRGETAHFDFVAGECARGLTQASLETGVPIAFGVLTTENEQQALARAGMENSEQRQGQHVETLTGNKGADAALCAIEMANVLRAI